MGRRVIDRSFYDALLQAFRVKPEHYSYAARAAKCDDRTAKKGWLEGWPEYSLPPIKDAVEMERNEARSRLEVARQVEAAKIRDQTDKARNDAIQIATDEIQVSRAVQVSAMNAIKLGNKILISMQRIYDFVHVRVNQLTEVELRALIDDPKKLAHYNRIVSTGAYLQSVARQLAQGAMEIERTRLGKPTQVLGVVVSDMTIDQLEHEIHALQKSIEQAKEDGLAPAAEAQVTTSFTNGNGTLQ